MQLWLHVPIPHTSPTKIPPCEQYTKTNLPVRSNIYPKDCLSSSSHLGFSGKMAVFPASTHPLSFKSMVAHQETGRRYRPGCWELNHSEAEQLLVSKAQIRAADTATESRVFNLSRDPVELSKPQIRPRDKLALSKTHLERNRKRRQKKLIFF
jgi:hypothetical protein